MDKKINKIESEKKEEVDSDVSSEEDISEEERIETLINEFIETIKHQESIIGNQQSLLDLVARKFNELSATAIADIPKISKSSKISKTKPGLKFSASEKIINMFIELYIWWKNRNLQNQERKSQETMDIVKNIVDNIIKQFSQLLLKKSSPEPEKKEEKPK